jgi:hypothetical protein
MLTGLCNRESTTATLPKMLMWEILSFNWDSTNLCRSFLAFSKILEKFYLLVPYALKLFCLVLFSRFFVNFVQVRPNYRGPNPEQPPLLSSDRKTRGASKDRFEP